MRLSRFITIVLVHGYQGSPETFGNFANDVSKCLKAKNSKTAHVRFYKYETHGDITKRVGEFVEWLTNPFNGISGNIMLLGHSMGGILCVDAAKTIAEFNRAYIGFSITHILAFDSPFLGVQEHVIGAKIVMRLLGSNDTNSDNRFSNTKDSSSSLWTWGVAAGAAVITAAVAYNSKA
ncbi:hypothetical protein HDU99_006206, partial [Rhizoclosmatium hyalinum]